MSASAEKKQIGRRSVARAAIVSEPEGIWTTGDRFEGGSGKRTTGQVNASYTAFLLRKASAARVNRRLRRYYLIVRLLPNVFALACLPLSSI